MIIKPKLRGSPITLVIKSKVLAVSFWHVLHELVTARPSDLVALVSSHSLLPRRVYLLSVSSVWQFYSLFRAFTPGVSSAWKVLPNLGLDLSLSFSSQVTKLWSRGHYLCDWLMGVTNGNCLANLGVYSFIVCFFPRNLSSKRARITAWLVHSLLDPQGWASAWHWANVHRREEAVLALLVATCVTLGKSLYFHYVKLGRKIDLLWRWMICI